MGRSKRRRRVDAKGRSSGGERFVKLDFALLNTAAYRSLSTGARALLVEFNRLYNGANNGELFMSQRKAAEMVGVTSHTTAAGYIDELKDRGFVRVRTKGSFSVKTRLATSYVLAQHPYNDLPATRDFRRWMPPKEQKQRARNRAVTGPKTGPAVPPDWPDEGDILAR